MKRYGIYSLEEVLRLVAIDPERKSLFIASDNKKFLIDFKSHRLLLFKREKDNLRCVCCGIEGKYFALECNDTDGLLTKKNFVKTGYKYGKPNYYLGNVYIAHFNLYANAEGGKEILMTKDHIKAKSKGGKNNLDNYQLMCITCNTSKGTYDWEMNRPVTSKTLLDSKNYK